MKKIPDHAERVFKGVLFDVCQWQQEMFDGSFATFEAVKRKDSVKVLAITESNKILISYEEQPGKPPFISLPGGQSDEGEDLLKCAERELLEETGYISENFQKWFELDIFKWNKFDWNIHFFIANNCKKISDQKLDSGEKVMINEVSFHEFLEISQEKDFNILELKDRIRDIQDNYEKIEEFRKEIFGE